MLTFKNEDAQTVVEKTLGEEGKEAIREGFGGDFLPFPDLEEAVKAEVQWLEGNKAIPNHVAVSGWVYEVETGKVRGVK